MAIDHAALATEIEDDPTGRGYKEAGGAWKDDAEIARLLSEAQPGITIYRRSVPMHEVYAEIDWDGDYLGLTTQRREAFRDITRSTALDMGSVHIREAFVAIFSGASGGTLARLDDLSKREGSRAEQLWGEGTVITHEDVRRAHAAA